MLRHLAAEAGVDVQVESAGTGGWHVGDDMDRRMAAELRKRGYDPDRHRAQQFGVDDFDRLDLVVALDETHLHELQAMAPTPAARHKVLLLGDCATTLTGPVPDPYYGGPSGFSDVLDRVEDGCRGLLDRLA